MFAAEYALSPREKMFFAKQALIESEKQEAAARKARRKSQHRLASMAPSLDSERSDSLIPEAGPSIQPARSGSISTRSILRRTSMSISYPAVSPRSSISVPAVQPSLLTSSPGTPSLIRAPSNTDFGPEMRRSHSTGLARRSSRVRFSTHEQAQEIFVPPAIPMTRSHSSSSKMEYRAMRRESSMDSLRQDIMTGRGSLNKRPSYASSIASDPFGWAARGSIESRLSMGGVLSDGDGPAADDDTEEFKPQSLRYPKLGPAFARLSIATSDSSVDSSGSSAASISSPSLRQTLDRASLDSTDVSISNKPSLDARLASMSSLSSYAPSYAPRMSSGSSVAGTDNGSQRSSLSSGLPPRENTAAYISLLPHRKSSGSHPMPSINRGEWMDAELGLSPRSGPTIFHTNKRDSVGSYATGSRRASLFSTTAPSPKSPYAVLVSPQLSDRTDNDDTPMRSDSIDFMSSATSTRTASSHKRTESTLSGIMSFPIPPDRALEPETTLVAKTGIVEKLLSKQNDIDADAQPTLSVEIVNVVETNLFVEAPLKEPIENRLLSNLTAETTTIWLNSPSPEFEATPSMLTTPDLLGVIVPPADGEVESSTTVEVVEERPRPKSPELSDVLRRIPRAKRARRRSTGSDGETEESDLDVNTPLVNVALRSNILSPSSRLLSTSPLAESETPSRRPSTARTTSSNSISTLSLKSGVSLTSGMGWSGSESEEEGWVETVRMVSLRRKSPPKLTLQLSTNATNTPTPTPKTFTRASIVPTPLSPIRAISVAMASEPLNRLSQLSSASMSTIESTVESTPLTPAAIDNLTPELVILGRTSSHSSLSESGSISSGSAPGDFPWGQSSPPASPVRARIRSRSAKSNGIGSGSISSISSSSSSRNDSSSSHSSRPELRRSKSYLPRPTKEVHGWGAPEVLMDDRDWESSMLVSASSSSSSLPTVSSLGTGFSTPSTFNLGLDPESENDGEDEDDIPHGGEWTSRRLSGARTFGSRTPQLGSPSANVETHDTTPKAKQLARAPSPDIWSALLQDDANSSLMDEEIPDDLMSSGSAAESSGSSLGKSLEVSEDEVVVPFAGKGAVPLRPRKSLLRMPSGRKLRPKI